jgi:hypothetical protein
MHLGGGQPSEARRGWASPQAQREAFEAAALGPYRVGMIKMGEAAKPPPLHVLGPGPSGQGPSWVPVWFRNAMWTEMPVLDPETNTSMVFIDIAVGGRHVWAINGRGRLYVLKPGATRFAEGAWIALGSHESGDLRGLDVRGVDLGEV